MTIKQLRSDLNDILKNKDCTDELVDYIKKSIMIITPGYHIPYDIIQPCPHCTGKASMFSWTDERGMPGSWDTYYYIQCSSCGSKTVEFSSYGQDGEKLCIESWNNNEIQKYSKIK